MGVKCKLNLCSPAMLEKIPVRRRFCKTSIVCAVSKEYLLLCTLAYRSINSKLADNIIDKLTLIIFIYCTCLIISANES